MQLRMLGGLQLVGSHFTAPQPLLLLAYLALNGACLRSEVQVLFWSHQFDKTKRIKSLSDALRRLKKLDPHLIEPGELRTYVQTDVAVFKSALAERRFEAAFDAYGGTFLRGIEDKRLHLGEELRDWLEATRQELKQAFVKAAITLAEEQHPSSQERSRDYLDAALKTSQTLSLPHGVKQQLYALATHLGVPVPVDTVDIDLNLTVRPLATTRLLGRDAELDTLAILFERGQRLVTISGLAGIGKTTLARAFTRTSFFDDSHFIELGRLPANTSEQLWQSLAITLGRPNGRKHEVLERLKSGSQLLVLDNFEPFLKHRSVLTGMLNACPRIMLLVTSRLPTGLRDEYDLRLNGLALPQQVTSLIQLRREPAGQLLLEEAWRKKVTLTDADTANLCELCHYTAGVPLALKLAAGWLQSVPLPSLVKRLNADLSVLRSKTASVTTALDLTVELLNPEAKRLLAELLVFKDGFTFEALVQLLKVRLDTVKQLVDASLIALGQERYKLHPLVERYLNERYEPNQHLVAQHARYYLNHLKDVLEGDELSRTNAVSYLLANQQNLFSAWRWTVARGDTAQLSALHRYLDVTAQAGQAVALLEESLQLTSIITQAEFRSSLAWFLMRLGHYEYAVRQAKDALQHLPAGSPARETCFNALGAASDMLGEFSDGQVAFEQALKEADLGTGEAANAMTNLALNALSQGRFETARNYLVQAETIFTEQGKYAKLVWCHYLYASMLLATGESLKARVKLEDTLSRAVQYKLEHWQFQIELKLAELFTLDNHTDRAIDICQQLSKCRPETLRGKEANLLSTLGRAHLASRQANEALSYFIMALSQLRHTKSKSVILHHLLYVLDAITRLKLNQWQLPLHGYCEANKTHMRYLDQQLLASFKSVPSDPTWQELSTNEVVALLLSDLSKGVGVSSTPFAMG